MLRQHVGHVAGQGKQLLLVDACMRNLADQSGVMKVPPVQTENKLFATVACCEG